MQPDDITNRIIRSNKPCYFISPHLDDAALSAGSLMSYLSRYTSVHVINVFTQPDKPPFTYSAKSFIKQCGFSDAQKLYAQRKKEDAFALENIAHHITNLDFTDALWRKRQCNNWTLQKIAAIIPESIHLYPTYYLHVLSGTIDSDDQSTLTSLRHVLQHTIDNGIVFSPLGIGNHVDHLIVHAACQNLFVPTIYWLDLPYALRSATQIKEKPMYSFKYSTHTNQKGELIRKYQTQYSALFKANTPYLEPEIFYTNHTF